jgi:hypothetical protein
MVTKNERNETIIKMHNAGETERKISEVTGMSKTGIHKIITSYLSEFDPVENDLKITPTVEPNKIFSSFVGFVRLSKNVYSNKDTGEVVNVKFVPSNDDTKFGNFVTC